MLKFCYARNWAISFVNSMKSLEKQIGVVGPLCKQGNIFILTHDFVHRTHLDIFEMNYYPPDLTDWWLDDWITRVYGSTRSTRLDIVEVVHHNTAHKRRYNVDHTKKTHLDTLITDGQVKIKKYMARNDMSLDGLLSFEEDTHAYDNKPHTTENETTPSVIKKPKSSILNLLFSRWN